MTTESVDRPETVTHPATGEVLERLDQQPPEVLAEALHILLKRQAESKTAIALLDGELKRRLAIRGRRAYTFGRWEVELERGQESVWDGEEVEGVLRELIDQGVLRAGEVTEAITHETVVHRGELNKILARLVGESRAALERCRTFRPKGPGKLRVEPSVALPQPSDDAAPGGESVTFPACASGSSVVMGLGVPTPQEGEEG